MTFPKCGKVSCKFLVTIMNLKGSGVLIVIHDAKSMHYF